MASHPAFRPESADRHTLEYLQRLQRKDPELIDDIVQQHARTLTNAAVGLGFRGPEAEDLVQDVFATFLSTIHHFQGRSQVRTWLFGILHHKSKELRRKLHRSAEMEPIDDVFESRFSDQGRWLNPPTDAMKSAESKQIGQAIKGCLSHLSDAQRRAFLLREVEEIKSENVRNILGVSSTNLGVLLFRARIRLRECLEARGWTANT